MISYEVCPKNICLPVFWEGSLFRFLGKIIYPNIFRLYLIGNIFALLYPSYVGYKGGYNAHDRIYILLNHGHFRLQIEQE